MKREYPLYPMVGVGVLVKRNNEILLVQRGREPAKGLWSIPGGLVELGEKVREAAKREVNEETGLDIEIEKIIDVIDSLFYDEKGRVQYHYVLIDFLAHPIGGTLRPASDILDAKWVKAEDLKNYKITKTLIQVLKKIGIASHQPT